MRALLVLVSLALVEAKPTCCWSKWGDASTCGNYSGTGAQCNTDPPKKCNSDSDCPDTPVPPSPPPPPPSPPSPPSPPTPPPSPPSPPTPPGPSPPGGLPKKTMGLYLLISDDGDDGQGHKWHYGSNTTWEPVLPDYMAAAEGPNVLFLAFVNPSLMPSLPPAMVHIGKNRPSGKKIIASVGGQAYSMHADQWPWLQSKEAAEAMAVEVAKWPEEYSIDGIDLDIEDGVGGVETTGPMVMAFVAKLRSLRPSMIITQPVYGFPQVKEENYVVNSAFAKNSTSKVDAIGIMTYSGTGSLNYVKNYADPGSQWSGFPIHSSVPKSSILVGACGCAGAGDIQSLAAAAKSQDLGGIMVWYSSVNDKATGKPGNQYGGGSMDSSNKATIADWAKALATMNGDSESVVAV